MIKIDYFICHGSC